MNIVKKTLYGLIKKLKFLPPAFYVKVYYEYYSGRKLNLKDPIEFNEKIQWLKVYYQPPILTQLVDKYAVRPYIKEKIGDKYLNDIIGVYSKFEDIDFDSLPNKFVLKGAHGSNYNLIVNDKSKLNKKLVKKLVNKWLSRNYYYRSGLEWAYKNVPPRVIAEKFMKEEGKEALNDYKFYCCNGKPIFIHVITDGSCSSNSGGRRWVADSGDRSMSLMGYYDPKGVNQVKTQLGHFTQGQIADGSTYVGRRTNHCSNIAFLNYLSTMDKVGDVRSVLDSTALPNSVIDESLAFTV